MFKKSSYVVFAVLIVFALLMSACGQAAPAATQAPAAPAATDAPAAPAAPEAPAAPAVTEAPAAPAAAERTTTKDVAVFANINDVGTLDPYADTAMQRMRVSFQVYEPLFQLLNDGSYEAKLAESWTWTDDTHLQVKLRQGVKFHNGNDLTADDVLFSLTTAAASLTAKFYANFDVENSKVVDANTVEIVTKSPDALAMSTLGSYLGIVDKETVEADPAALPSVANGTGPYTLVEWVTGDSVTLERNDAYWGEKAIIKTLIFRAISEITQRGIELQTGGVDFAFDLGAASLAAIEGDPNVAVLKQPSTLVNNIIFNTTTGHAFENEDLRKAAASAIDAASIIKGAYDGNGTVPLGYVSSAAPGFNASFTSEPWPQDLAKAKEFFAASGVAEGTEINIVVDDRAPRVSTTEIIKNQLAAVGLVANIQSYDFGTAINIALDPTNDWDIFLLGNGGATATIQSQWLNGSAPFVTFPGTEAGAELSALVKELQSTVDATKAQELNNQVQTYVNEHVVIYPVQQDQVLYGFNANLVGVPESMIGFAIVDCADLYFK